MDVKAQVYNFTLVPIAALALCLLGGWVYKDVDNRTDSHVVVVDAIRSHAERPALVKAERSDVTTNNDSRKKFEYCSLAQQFDTASRNAGWADSIEKSIRGDLHRYNAITHLLITCKSSICRASGDIRSSNPSEINTILQAIRRAVRFDQPSDGFVKRPDNTVYTVANPQPLIISFSNYSRW